MRTERIHKASISILLVMVTMFFFPQFAVAVIYYVDNKHINASDSNIGSESSPFKTIQKAANIAKAGDTVYVKTGIYKEFVNVANSGTSGNPIIFKSFDKQTPVIDGTGVDVPSYQALFHAQGKNYITIDGLEIRNSDEYLVKIKSSDHCSVRNSKIHHNANVRRSGILIASSNHCIIEYNEVYESGRNAINCESSSNTIIKYNYVHDNIHHNGINLFPKTSEKQLLYNNNHIIGNRVTGCTHGIYLRYQTGQVIANNLIYANLRPGINFQTHPDDPYDYDADTLIVNNTIVDNGGDGIENLNARMLTIKNNIIAFNDGTYLLDFDSSVLTKHDIDYNLYYGNSFKIGWGGTTYSSLSTWKTGSTNGAHSIWADPRFVNRSSYNYDINNTSVAIDSGIDLTSRGIKDDLNKTARPQKNAFDIGAIEHSICLPVDPPNNFQIVK